MSIQGNLFIMILECKDMNGVRWYRSAGQIYAKIFVDKQKVFKSTISDKTGDPKWEEKAFHMNLSDKNPASILRIKMFDYSNVIWDKCLGEVSFELKDLVDGVPRNDWFPLKHGKSAKEFGKAHIQIYHLDPEEKMTPSYDEFIYPLQTLMQKKKFKAFDLALDSKELETADNSPSANRPLHAAAALNLPECVTHLLDKHAQIEGTNGEGATPLHVAAQFSLLATKILLSKGANKAAKDSKGRSPLHYAARGNNAAVIKFLLENEADVNIQDNEGSTPLHLALREKDAPDAIRALVEGKADVWKEDNNGWPCVKLCMDESRVQIRARNELFKAADVIDEREFAIMRDFPHRNRVEGPLTGFWQKNPHFSFHCPNQQNPTNAVRIIMAFDDDDGNALLSEKMSKCGFFVIGSNQNEHKEPSFQTGVEYGTIEPLSIILKTKEKIEEEAAQAPAEKKSQFSYLPYRSLIPYGKSENVKGRFRIAIYSQEQLEIKELVDWKCTITAVGEWNEKTGGGCKTFIDTWASNPRYRFRCPKGKKDLKMCIMLSQTKAGMDFVAYQVVPYQFFIGYYILEDLDIVFENKNWKNALDVWDTVTLDTSKETDFTLVPTTFKQGQHTGFTITIFSDDEIQFIM